MKKLSTIYFPSALVIFLTTCFPSMIYGQLDADLTTTDNTNCNGSPCTYSGPSILINELMMSPTTFDGSLWGGSATQRGEWIELYNPNICEPIDISCYYLGNNANDNSPYPGGYVIPPGTVVPPAGFALIRGVNAAAVPSQLLVENGGNVVELEVTGVGVCVGGGSRLWFPNAGGWFAFYDADGVPQDAVSWATQSNAGNYPCVPTLTGCGFSGTLPNYNEFPNDRKNYILNTSASDFSGQSIRRIPDGGTWSGPGAPTYAICNTTCVDAESINCNGTATANPVGGTPPYTYLWNDPQSQNTQIADQLCAGQYCVLITDALGNTFNQCIDVEDVVYQILITDAICDGESYTLPNNQVVTTAGDYPILLQTGNGCDSLITVSLEVHPSYEFELNPQICQSDAYTLPDGTEVSTTGTYNFAYQTVNGCDSLYNINLVVASPIQIVVDAQICEGNTYELPDGTEVGNVGQYSILVAGDPALCDTLFTINLAFHIDFQIEFNELNHISCFGEQDGSVSLDINGTSGPYTYEWSDGIDHGSLAESLELGSYSVEVTDDNGCKADTLFEIIEPTVVSLTASAEELICFGSESNLIAEATGGTGDFEYHWNHTTSNAPSSTVSPTEDTDYSVFANDENGCKTDTITLNVAVITMHSDSLEVSEGDSLCFGSSTIISASYSGQYPPYAYTWSNGLPDGPGPFSVSPNATTSYTVMVTDDCGNTVSKEIPVIVWSLPIVAIDTIANVTCFNENDGRTEISVSGGNPGYSYTWSDEIEHGAQADNLEPGTYSVEVADINGCKAETLFEILEPTVVSLTASAEELICFGSESNLIAEATGGTGDFEYHWNHTTSNAPSSTVSPTEDTDYSVFANDENGCETDTITLSVTVISMYSDSLEVSASDSLCIGSSTTLLASYSGQYPPYIYTWSNGLPDGPGPNIVSPDSTTAYTITVTDDCGNSVSKEIPVVVWSLPVAAIDSIASVTCFGENNGYAEIAVTQGTPGYSFSWSDGQEHGAIGEGLIPATYNVDISDAHGCETNISFAISEPAPLEISLTGDTLICLGAETTLFATATGGTGDKTYHWNHTASVLGNSNVSPQVDTLYTVFAQDANGCVSEEIELTVAVMSMDPGLLSISSDTAICPGEFASLSGFYSGNYPPYTYSWTGGVEIGMGPHSVSPSETTTFELTVSDICDNTLTANVEVELYESPIAILPNDLLSGCSPLEINLIDPFNNTSGYSHEWLISNSDSQSGNPVSVVLTDPGIYEVTLIVTSPEGCSALSENAIPVEVFALPVANFNASPWSTSIENPEINFTDISTGSVFSIWTIDNTTVQNQIQTAYTFSDTGRYAVQLYVETEFGCRDSITKWITIEIDHSVEIPNAFTPSNPGDNPYYDPKATSNTVFYPFSDYVSDYQLSIFNRWGELIFESSEFEMGWNGTYRDEPCPQDVYVYKVEFRFTDGKKRTKVGDVTLFR
ncbi:T9SS type B sorting domain-containing protein [Cryomorpha ignava]|uniref:T9SS type B sorting domain-containing protein n=1 Tax=Cryomorpha ignava TaxID=101383 RepID=A0A7K3WR11_9FLAO|nr:gliding motility-associated C-terminal domain-containing protein [Cryomorpha ignava]NEN23282.1 T9SS type B sorting domain-containing protein [Cryomorpha ignava]